MSEEIKNGIIEFFSKEENSKLLFRYVPIGTIVAYGGQVIPEKEGWFRCDGRALNINNFNDLFKAIGANWGGDGNPFFNIPDLRGVFLRGTIDNEVYKDENKLPENNSEFNIENWLKEVDKDWENSRFFRFNYLKKDINGNPIFNKGIGTYQRGEVVNHTHDSPPHSHEVRRSNNSTGDGGGSEWPVVEKGKLTVDSKLAKVTINPFGGSETRPFNAAVNWIIKCL